MLNRKPDAHGGRGWSPIHFDMKNYSAAAPSNTQSILTFGAPKVTKDHLPPSAAKTLRSFVNAGRFVSVLGAGF